MANIKVVIGSNFGDEGKGLMTDYFAYESKKCFETCIVVCHNGGAQRGHTVVLPNGKRHVFHHFGSGTFQGASTYLSEEFILNPIIFKQEWDELIQLGYIPVVYVHENCKLSTPYDAFINQIVEENRGKNKHGSCGLGIWETIKRYDQGIFSMRLPRTENMLKGQLSYIKNRYLPKRIKELGCTVSKEWQEIINNEGLIKHFVEDYFFMMNHIEISNDRILENYDAIIFESGQGLLLDQNRIEYGDNITPSNTGIMNPKKIISALPGEHEIEICYVTRTYMTRHGVGRFDSECDKSEINASIIDLTNVPNPFQDSIRYGKLDYHDLFKRIEHDFDDYKAVKSLAITHCNEFDKEKRKIGELFSEYKIYESNGMTHNEVENIGFMNETPNELNNF